MHTSLVLTGGGARAAYQIGVLKGIAEIVDDDKPFDSYIGASAGAINAVHLASMHGDFAGAVIELAQLWGSLRSESVYDIGWRRMFGMGFSLMKDILLWHRESCSPIRYLLDTAPLRRLLTEHNKIEQLHQKIRKGELSGLVLAATDYREAATAYFIETAHRVENWRRHRRYSLNTRIGIDHMMASSAIPMFFPPVRINERYYGDGAIRNIYPLSPAVHLGADKILAIGVRNPVDECASAKATRPSPARLGSLLIDAIFLDAVDSDIELLQATNRIACECPEVQRSPLREIEVMNISPSVDISHIAHDYARLLPLKLSYLLSGLGTRKEAAALTSYFLFEAEFSQAMIELGYKDTIEQAVALKQFFV